MLFGVSWLRWFLMEVIDLDVGCLMWILMEVPNWMPNCVKVAVFLLIYFSDRGVGSMRGVLVRQRRLTYELGVTSTS